MSKPITDFDVNNLDPFEALVWQFEMGADEAIADELIYLRNSKPEGTTSLVELSDIRAGLPDGGIIDAKVPEHAIDPSANFLFTRLRQLGQSFDRIRRSDISDDINCSGTKTKRLFLTGDRAFSGMKNVELVR